MFYIVIIYARIIFANIYMLYIHFKYVLFFFYIHYSSLHRVFNVCLTRVTHHCSLIKIFKAPRVYKGENIQCLLNLYLCEAFTFHIIHKLSDEIFL